MKKVKDVMTRDSHLIAANATVAEASKMMAQLDIGMLPVTEDGRLLGTITDRDIVIRTLSSGMDPNKTPVSQAMTADVIALHEEEDIQQAARLMQEKQVRRLIVVDAEKRPTGVMSLGDLALHTRNKQLAGETLTEVSRPMR